MRDINRISKESFKRFNELKAELQLKNESLIKTLLDAFEDNKPTQVSEPVKEDSPEKPSKPEPKDKDVTEKKVAKKSGKAKK